MGAEFDGKKIVVVGGSAGMGRQAALDVIDRGGSAVIIGRSKGRVDDTVAELTNRRGQAWGIAAELTDRSAGPPLRLAHLAVRIMPGSGTPSELLAAVAIDAASIDSAARHLLDGTDRQSHGQDAFTPTAQRRSAAPT